MEEERLRQEALAEKLRLQEEERQRQLEETRRIEEEKRLQEERERLAIEQSAVDERSNQMNQNMVYAKKALV